VCGMADGDVVMTPHCSKKLSNFNGGTGKKDGKTPFSMYGSKSLVSIILESNTNTCLGVIKCIGNC